MTKKQMEDLRDTELVVNQDGDFLFTKRGKKTIVYGPVSFKEAMIICWEVMKDYKGGKNNE